MPMASGNKCANCGKGIMVGHNVSHAKNRTRKVFKPNLHSTRMTVGGTSMKVKLCTKCLRVLKGRTTMAKKSIRQAQDKAAQAKEQAELKEKELSSSAPVASGLA